MKYYELKQETQKTILELIKTAEKNHLGNVSFMYYGGRGEKAAKFVMNAFPKMWALTVVSNHEEEMYSRFPYRDIYEIEDGEFKYMKSERD